MNIAEHFQLYRAQLKVESLPGCVEYAKQKVTAKPEAFATAYDYLLMAMGRLRDIVAVDDRQGYAEWLPRHQYAMVSIFEEMVAESLWDYRQIDAESLLRLIDTEGLGWFKFSAKSLEFKLDLGGKKVDLILVPRYDQKYQKTWGRDGVAVFDANEAAAVFSGRSLEPGKTSKVALEVVAFKLSLPRHKVVRIEGGVASHKPVAKLNKEGGVDDWTLPLW